LGRGKRKCENYMSEMLEPFVKMVKLGIGAFSLNKTYFGAFSLNKFDMLETKREEYCNKKKMWGV